MKKGFKKTIFIIAVCLVLLELCLQAAGLILTPRAKKSDFTKNTFNILCIGDSFTYGIGAPQEDSYPRQLERLLQQEYKEADIRVINRGIPGYNSSQSARLLKKEFDLYNPRIVLVMTGLNNLWNWMDSSYFEIKHFKDDHPIKYYANLADMQLSRIKIYKMIKIIFHPLNKNQSTPGHQKNAILEIKDHQTVLRSKKLLELLSVGGKYYGEGKYDLAEPYYREAMALAPEDFEPHWYMGRILRVRSNEQEAEKELLIALKYSGDPFITISILSEIKDQTAPKNSETFRNLADLIKEKRKTWIDQFGDEYVKRLIDPLLSSENDIRFNVLNYDLEEMKNYLAARQAELVVLSYPCLPKSFGLPENIYGIISQHLDLPLIDNSSVFEKYLGKNNLASVFVADGHCTNQGYKMIAENVLRGLKKNNLLNGILSR